MVLYGNENCLCPKDKVFITVLHSYPLSTASLAGWTNIVNLNITDVESCGRRRKNQQIHQ